MRRALFIKDLRLHSLPLVLTWLLMVATMVLVRSPRYLYGVPRLLMIYGSFILIAPVALSFFAGETGSGTDAFLHTFPVSRRTIWWRRFLLVVLHALLVSLLSLAIIRHSMATLPAAAEMWNYTTLHWSVLDLLSRYYPFVSLLVFGIAVLTATTSRSTRSALLPFLLLVGLSVCTYLALADLSGTFFVQWQLRRGAGIAEVDWLVAAEIVAAALVCVLLSTRAFARTAVREVALRRKRANRLWALGLLVFVALVLPFHLWANSPSGSSFLAVGRSRSLSPDREHVALFGSARKLGRLLDLRVAVVDLQRKTLRHVCQTSDADWLKHLPHTLMFRRRRILWWPRYEGRGVIDAGTHSVKNLSIPGLRVTASKASRMRLSKYWSEPEVNPRTCDLLLSLPRTPLKRGVYAYLVPNDLWWLSRDGKRLKQVLRPGKGSSVSSFSWDRAGTAAIATVDRRSPNGSQIGQELWWVPLGKAHGRAPSAFAGQARRIFPDTPRRDYPALPQQHWLSAHQQWIVFQDDLNYGDRTSKGVVIRKFSGGGGWRIPIDRRTRWVDSRWSPTGARLAVVCPFEEGGVEVVVCDAQKRKTLARLLLPLPGRLAQGAIIGWSLDGRRLLVRVAAHNGNAPSNQDSFWGGPVETSREFLFDVEVDGGTVNRLYGPVSYRYRPQANRRETVEQVISHMLQPLGYDRGGSLVVLKGGRELFRLDPETRRVETILKWR